MDWCMDNRVPGAADALTVRVLAHLDRHASGPAMVELARPLVATALSGQPAGCHWVSLDWEHQHCRLVLRALDGGALTGDALVPGLTAAHLVAADLHRNHVAVQAVQVDLDVTRPHEPDLDPGPAPGTEAIDHPVAVTGLLAAELIAGRDPGEAAAVAGSSAAASAGGQPVTDLRSAAAAFLALERSLGADFHVVTEGPDRVVLANRRCPFGTGPPATLCRFTSAAAGSFGARACGEAAVVLDERIALGDSQCRLVLSAGDGGGTAAHRYRWPASGAGVAGPPADGVTPPAPTGGFRVTLSLQLPRDRLSVPVTRHLVAAAMGEVGVLRDDAAAVELAVTEACANVVDHAGPGDAYDVAITIEPSHCHIRVVDIGRGFDHANLTPPEMAALDAEHGRGVALMHALVDQVRFESEPERGTVVHLVKRLHFDDSVPARRLLTDGGG